MCTRTKSSARGGIVTSHRSHQYPGSHPEMIFEPPPTGEDAGSALGRLRYYNLCDMVLVVSNAGITATSGHFDNFRTAVLTNEWIDFCAIANSFSDAREGKTVQPIDIDIGKLAAWSLTNTSSSGSRPASFPISMG